RRRGTIMRRHHRHRRARSYIFLLHRFASVSSSLRALAIMDGGTGSTAPADFTADTLIGVIVIITTGANQNSSGGLRPPMIWIGVGRPSCGVRTFEARRCCRIPLRLATQLLGFCFDFRKSRLL